ncbi:response regulator transcription factor [Arenibacter certesii]|uniref:HTH luxR-type domain-containing protein n=1 Tax=Arenibacter certesii TaxID=228955 RepID=A0A918IX59_9FLAO|nr:helix-turn-helix transcriptional regulator [Arenibacter certesii]GGW37069.1 hypothetical protein GCM10007383_22410 [Arenibacter certesii]
MKVTEINDCLNPNIICEKVLLTRIAKIVAVCERSKNLMVGIYLIEKAQFLYCNQGCKNILANNLPKLWSEGWSFWFSKIDLDEVMYVMELLNNFFVANNSQSPLILKYHIATLEGKRICVKHEIYLHQMEFQRIAVNYIYDVSVKEQVEECFQVPQSLNDISFPNNNCLQISGREQEVLEHIANGFSSKEIADMLFISNHTVVSHRKNLIEKFQVKNTAHLIKKAAAFI